MHNDTPEAHHSTNGLTPSQKAWQTAKDRAVAESEARRAENSARWHAQKEETLRAVLDVNLSHGSARLFSLLAIAGWEKEFGGLYKDRVGSVFIDGRRLARLCGGASVNVLYHKTRREKLDPKSGKVLRGASETTGWIEELVRGGYLWVSKHRIPNIPPAKWPNVYNLACHVPQRTTPNLPWTDGNFGSENVIVGGCSPAENRNFAGQDVPGDREKAENPLASHRSGGLPVTGTEDRLSPERRTGNHRNGGQAVTGTEDRQSPERRTGNHRNGGQAVTAAEDRQTAKPVQLRESVGGNPSLVANGGGDNPTTQEASPMEKQLTEWRQSLNGSFPSRLEKLQRQLAGQRQTMRKSEARDFLDRKLAMLREILEGPLPAYVAPAPKPAPSSQEKPLTKAELLAGAEYLVSVGKADMMTGEQRIAWEAR